MDLEYQIPSTILLLRTPIPPKEGTDPYHDVFGSFCLPSFPTSALDSGAATPIAPFANLTMTGRSEEHPLHPGAASRPLSRSASGSSADRVRIAATLAGMTPTNAGQSEASTDGNTGQDPSTSSSAAPSSSSSGPGPRPEEVLLERLQQQQQAQLQEANLQRRDTSRRDHSQTKPSYSATTTTSTGGGSSSNPESSSTSLVLTTHHSSVDSQGQGREWCVTSMPVLGSQSVNRDTFQTMLAEEEWGGVVATSNRAWDAWKDAVKQCSKRSSRSKTNWPDTPFFLISSRSAATFRQELDKLPNEWIPKANKVYGAPPKKGGSKPTASSSTNNETSAGEALGEYILGWLTRRRDASHPTTTEGTPSDEPSPLLEKPLLLLQGDKSLAALPSFLESHRIPYKNIEVYSTCADRALLSNLHKLQIMYQSLSSEEDDNLMTLEAVPDWITFFSPSGVDYSYPALKELGWFPDIKSNSARPRIVTLGNTTANHLKEKYGFVIAGSQESQGSAAEILVATSADPQGIKEALDRAENGTMRSSEQNGK
ncbi:unnamed protein product [Sympodiomycopsis kandeliae]